MDKDDLFAQIEKFYQVIDDPPATLVHNDLPEILYSLQEITGRFQISPDEAVVIWKLIERLRSEDLPIDFKM